MASQSQLFGTTRSGRRFGTTGTTRSGRRFGTTGTTHSGSRFGTTGTTRSGRRFGTTGTTHSGSRFGTTTFVLQKKRTSSFGVQKKYKRNLHQIAKDVRKNKIPQHLTPEAKLQDCVYKALWWIKASFNEKVLKAAEDGLFELPILSCSKAIDGAIEVTDIFSGRRINFEPVIVEIMDYFDNNVEMGLEYLSQKFKENMLEYDVEFKVVDNTLKATW